MVLRYEQNTDFDRDHIVAHGGPSAATQAQLGGAGTVYIQHGDETEFLKVSNFDPISGRAISSVKPTPMEVVGRHTIETVTKLGDERWLVKVAGTFEPHRDYSAYLIDPDASDLDGPYCEIVGRQGENGLIVDSTVDLSGIAGNELTGVHELPELLVDGGAAADFGEDWIILTGDDGLDVASDSAMQTSGLIVNDLDLTDQRITVNRHLKVVHNLTASSIAQGVVIQADTITVGADASFDGVTVISPSVAIQGNLTLTNGATLTVPAADESAYYPLDIVVDQTLRIDNAAVDVSDKGYAPGRTWNNATHSANLTGGSHAGIGGWGDNSIRLDAYGDYLHAQYPGSGGRSDTYDGAPGGGAVRTRADLLDLNKADILANGSMSDSTSHPTGAGGSIDIEVGEISAASTDYQIAANGGGSWDVRRDHTGGGGHVVLRYGQDVGFDLNRVSAHGGPSDSGSDKMGSAGSIYTAQIGQPGTLTVSNFDPLSGRTVISGLPTPSEVVGRHRIAHVEDQGNDRWSVDIWQAMEGVFESGCLDLSSGVVYHPFEVLEEAAIDLHLAFSTGGGPGEAFPEVRIFRDDGDLTDDDLVELSDVAFPVPLHFDFISSVTLAAGSYMLAIGEGPLDPNDAGNDSGLECGQYGPSWISAYELSIQVDQKISPDKYPVGYFIDLDGSDVDGPYYEIVDVDYPNRLIVSSSDNLSGAVGSDLVGIHFLAGLQVEGGATADFGSDRVIITESDGLQVEPDTSLQVGSLQVGDLPDWTDVVWPAGFTLTLNDLTIQDWKLIVQGHLALTDDLSITGVNANAALDADTIAVAGEAQISNATVIASEIDVQGDLTLRDGAKITTSAVAPYIFYPLDITVGNGIYVWSDSSIDVSGKGYPRGTTWNNEPYSAFRTGGSHAGIGGRDSSFEMLSGYGDYLHAGSAGSGGIYASAYGAPGNGAVRINALLLELDNGFILANGDMGASSDDPTGAGGSVDIDVDIINVLDNSSRIAANGGGAWNTLRYYTGGGGLVVLRYDDQIGLDFERVSAHGGPSSYSEGKMGSAGTVYIEQAGEPGSLKVSNFDPVFGQAVASGQPTPLEVVGKHQIASVTDLGGNHWLIQVAESLAPHRNYAGYLIDPDASDVAGPYYEILETRGANELLVYSENDLRFFDDGEPVGVHELSQLKIEGGAAVDFGWDRPLVPGADAVVITADIAELQAGSFSGWENVAWPQGIDLTLNGDSTVYEWRLSNMNWDLTLNGRLEVTQDMAIRSQDMAITIQADAITVGGAATFSGVGNGFVTIVTPVLDIAGTLFFDAGFEHVTEIPGEVAGGFSEDFEDANLDGWTTDGDAYWYATTDDAHAGAYSAGSGYITDDEESTISRTAEVSGTLRFWWKVSSEEDYDYLEFYINGNFQADISGETDWQLEEYTVSEGDEIMWRYMKDYSYSEGLDRGWIDDVSLTE